MSKEKKGYSSEFKERAVKLAVESEQSVARTARDLGINENTLHTWIRHTPPYPRQAFRGLTDQLEAHAKVPWHSRAEAMR
jgi:transposase